MENCLFNTLSETRIMWRYQKEAGTAEYIFEASCTTGDLLVQIASLLQFLGLFFIFVTESRMWKQCTFLYLTKLFELSRSAKSSSATHLVSFNLYFKTGKKQLFECRYFFHLRFFDPFCTLGSLYNVTWRP